MTRPLRAERKLPRPSRRVAAALAAVLGVALLAAPSVVRAQSKSDAFAGKIPPVSSFLYRKAGRFEGTLSGNLSLNDAFYTKYFGGAKVSYHFTESLSAGALVMGGLNTKAGSTQLCPSNGGCRGASKFQMYQVPGNIRMIAGVEGAWSPIYGKLNLFSERVAHFDLSLVAGADWIQYQKVISREQAQLFEDEGGKPGNSATIGGHIGVGARVFFAEWIAARVEFRDYVYRVSVPNWQEGGGDKRDLQNQLFTELGVSFFFPLKNRPVQ